MTMNWDSLPGGVSTRAVCERTLTSVTRPAVPFVDVGEGAAAAHAERRIAQALAVRDACLGWLPLGGLLA